MEVSVVFVVETASDFFVSAVMELGEVLSFNDSNWLIKLLSFRIEGNFGSVSNIPVYGIDSLGVIVFCGYLLVCEHRVAWVTNIDKILVWVPHVVSMKGDSVWIQMSKLWSLTCCDVLPKGVCGRRRGTKVALLMGGGQLM